MDLSIVIPVHNEAMNIGELLDEISRCVGHDVEYEIICVDDHSADATQSILQQKELSIQQLRHLRLARQSGQSCALRKGVEIARSENIVSLDGDGQNDPADIPVFLQLLREKTARGESCLVIGHRTKREDSCWRQFTSKVANRIRNLALQDNTPDSGCGIKAFPRQLFLRLPPFNHMHRFLPALVQSQGGFIVSHPVNHRPRQGGKSHYGTLDRLAAGVVDILGVMWLRRRAMVDRHVQQES